VSGEPPVIKTEVYRRLAPNATYFQLYRVARSTIEVWFQPSSFQRSITNSLEETEGHNKDDFRLKTKIIYSNFVYDLLIIKRSIASCSQSASYPEEHGKDR